MKAVDHKVNIVPVIAKADTLKQAEVIKLKRKEKIKNIQFLSSTLVGRGGGGL